MITTEQCVVLVNTFHRGKAVLGAPQVESPKLVSRCGLIFRVFGVNAAHPEAAAYEIFRQMMSDETARAGD